MELVAADIGGRRARFALANVEGLQIMNCGDADIFTTVEHAIGTVAACAEQHSR